MSTEEQIADTAQSTAGEPGNAQPEAAAAQDGTILGSAEGTAPEQSGQVEAAAQVPESYDFTQIIPEGMEYNEQQAAAFSAIAKDCGLTQDQAAKVAAYGMQYAKDGVALAEQQRIQTINGWGEAARSELGASYDHTVSMAARGIRTLETKVPGIKAMLNETGAGNRIEMIRLLAEFGSLTGDDAGRTGGTAGAAASNVYAKTNFNKYI